MHMTAYRSSVVACNVPVTLHVRGGAIDVNDLRNHQQASPASTFVYHLCHNEVYMIFPVFTELQAAELDFAEVWRC